MLVAKVPKLGGKTGLANHSGSGDSTCTFCAERGAGTGYKVTAGGSTFGGRSCTEKSGVSAVVGKSDASSSLIYAHEGRDKSFGVS